MNDADEESPAARLAALPAGTLVVLSDSAGLLSAEPPAYALRPIPPLPPGAAPRALPRSLPPGSLFVVLRCGDFLGFKSLRRARLAPPSPATSLTRSEPSRAAAGGRCRRAAAAARFPSATRMCVKTRRRERCSNTSRF